MNNIEQFDINGQCCGCTACYNVCPVNAISILQNDKGFYVPKIGTNCIRCGKCVSVCSIGKENEGRKPGFVYAAKAKDEHLRMQSSSGGLFSILAEACAVEYGSETVFWGAAWDEKLTVRHMCETIDRIDIFHGSKYVQSRLDNTYSCIKEQLENGQAVVFSGTGCQCAGLRRYLAVERISDEKLFVIDIICHGVPSVKLWQDYLKLIEDNASAKVVNYLFRDKSVSWHGIHPQITLENNTVLSNDKQALSYGTLFGNLSLNSVCYSCKYATDRRYGDITLGDFWGVEKHYREIDDGKGISICLLNTKKGIDIFEKMGDAAIVAKVEDDSYLQPQLREPTKSNVRYEVFWSDYLRKGYAFVAKKYAQHSKLYVFLRDSYKKIRAR